MHTCTRAHTHMHALIHVFVAMHLYVRRRSIQGVGKPKKIEQLKYNGFVREVSAATKYQPKLLYQQNSPKPEIRFLWKNAVQNQSLQTAVRNDLLSLTTHITLRASFGPMRFQRRRDKWQQFQKRATGGRTAPRQLRQPYV